MKFCCIGKLCKIESYFKNMQKLNNPRVHTIWKIQNIDIFFFVLIYPQFWPSLWLLLLFPCFPSLKIQEDSCLVKISLWKLTHTEKAVWILRHTRFNFQGISLSLSLRPIGYKFCNNHIKSTNNEKDSSWFVCSNK